MKIEQYKIISQTIENNLNVLAERAVTIQYRRNPCLYERYGEKGCEKSVRDVCYTLQYLGESLRAGTVALFADYMRWCRITLKQYGVAVEDFNENTDIIAATLSEMLDGELSKCLHNFLKEAFVRANRGNNILESYILPGAPLSDLALGYTNCLLQGDRHGALRLVSCAADDGTPVRDLYEHVFQVSQHEIGRLWQLNKISVAQEHFCTAATQFIMSRLYPKVFSTQRKGRTLIAACVNGELHELGIRKAAAFFKTISRQKAAFNWEMPVGADHRKTSVLHFFGCSIKGAIYILAVESGDDIDMFVSELTAINNRQAESFCEVMKVLYCCFGSG